MSDPVGLVIQLGVVGPVPTRVGQNILSIIGTATHGPAMTPIALTNSQQCAQYFKGGDLYYQGTFAFGQGVTTVYFVRVLGANYAAASVNLLDQSGTVCGTISATSDGIVGNSLSVEVTDGVFDSYDAESFPGDGTAGPYALEKDDLVVDATHNWVKVNNVAKTIVYTSPPDPGEVYVNTTTGALTFGDTISKIQNITCSIRCKTRNLIISDGENTPVTISGIRDQIGMEAVLMYNANVTYEPVATITHLPATGTYTLVGGLDGDAIDSDDYYAALQLLMDEMEESGTGTTTAVLCDYECENNTHDLIPVMDLWLTEMEANYMPCLGFVGLEANISEPDAVAIANNFGNRLLSIVVNPWDNTVGTRRNGAVARAATEARVGLGESAAQRMNCLRGMNGLLNSYRKPTVKTLHNNGLDVLVKRGGVIVPYMGRSVAKDWAFIRCVDNRTVNAMIVAIKYITDQFYFRKNTPGERSSLKRSIAAVLDEQVALQNIRVYTLRVERVPTDPNRVNVFLEMENIGHMEFFYVKFDVGILDQL